MRSQSGFTMIELAVTTALVGLLALAASSATFQVFKSAQRNRDHMVAVRQVQNAGFWIGKDGSMARTVVEGDDVDTPQLEFVTFKWTDWSTGDMHQVVYYLQDMPGGLKKLMRQYRVTDYTETIEKWDVSTHIAEGILSTISFQERPRDWRLSVAAKSGNLIEQRTYDVEPRVNI